MCLRLLTGKIREKLWIEDRKFLDKVINQMMLLPRIDESYEKPNRLIKK